MRWPTIALSLWLCSCSAEAPAPEPAAPPAPRELTESDIPLERLLQLREEPGVSAGFGTPPRPDAGPAPDGTSPVPEWLETEVSGGTERVEVVGPGRTVESAEVGVGVGYKDPESEVSVGVEGRVRDESSEDFPDADKRDESIRLKITVPFDGD